MEIMLLILIIMLIVFLLFVLIKKGNNANKSSSDAESTLKEIKQSLVVDLKKDLLLELSENTVKTVGCLSSLERKVNEDLFKFNEAVQNKLDFSMDTLTTRVDVGATKTNTTFNAVNERLVSIIKAQENIELLSSNILSLQDILNNTKQRGILGEVQLYQVLSSVYGSSSRLYAKQYKLSNDTIVDSILFTPKPLGNICIDSKFPLENYKKTLDDSLSVETREKAKKDFIVNMKKHIDDISNKYIIKDETSEQAILFIPVESVFTEIHSNYYDKIIDYAHNKKVWIASPTTLIALLGLLQGVTKDLEIRENIDTILNELKSLSVEFDRFDDRWQDLSKQIVKVNDVTNKLGITTSKITKKFNSIVND